MIQRFLAWLLAVGVGVVLVSCQPSTYPRPFGYHRIEFPERSYRRYQPPDCDFSFEYPSYAELQPPLKDYPCAITLYFPAFDAYWHITDRDFMRDGADEVKSFEDYRIVVYKHSQKATNIQETPYDWPAGRGVLFELWGAVPTSAQFYLSDEHNNALMASFYFKTATKNDSLAPVIDFLKEDLLHLAGSVEFR